MPIAIQRFTPRNFTKQVSWEEFLASIGAPGTRGFGIGVYPGELPYEFAETDALGCAVPGRQHAASATRNPLSARYGNYLHWPSGSEMVFIPAHAMGIRASDEHHTPAHSQGVEGNPKTPFNSIRPYFTDEPDATTKLQRSFINGGEEKPGIFIDKWHVSAGREDGSGTPNHGYYSDVYTPQASDYRALTIDSNNYTEWDSGSNSYVTKSGFPGLQVDYNPVEPYDVPGNSYDPENDSPVWDVTMVVRTVNNHNLLEGQGFLIQNVQNRYEDTGSVERVIDAKSFKYTRNEDRIARGFSGIKLSSDNTYYYAHFLTGGVSDSKDRFGIFNYLDGRTYRKQKLIDDGLDPDEVFRGASPNLPEFDSGVVYGSESVSATSDQGYQLSGTSKKVIVTQGQWEAIRDNFLKTNDPSGRNSMEIDTWYTHLQSDKYGNPSGIILGYFVPYRKDETDFEGNNIYDPANVGGEDLKVSPTFGVVNGTTRKYRLRADSFDLSVPDGWGDYFPAFSRGIPISRQFRWPITAGYSFDAAGVFSVSSADLCNSTALNIFSRNFESNSGKNADPRVVYDLAKVRGDIFFPLPRWTYIMMAWMALAHQQALRVSEDDAAKSGGELVPGSPKTAAGSKAAWMEEGPPYHPRGRNYRNRKDRVDSRLTWPTVSTAAAFGPSSNRTTTGEVTRPNFNEGVEGNAVAYTTFNGQLSGVADLCVGGELVSGTRALGGEIRFNTENARMENVQDQPGGGNDSEPSKSLGYWAETSFYLTEHEDASPLFPTMDSDTGRNERDQIMSGFPPQQFWDGTATGIPPNTPNGQFLGSAINLGESVIQSGSDGEISQGSMWATGRSEFQVYASNHVRLASYGGSN